jgi:hypothetical protein
MLKLALNPNLVDKNELGRASLFSTGWVNSELTLDEFRAAITVRGWAYCAQLKGARKGSNFQACNIASVDVDYGLTVEEALANPSCETTPSCSTRRGATPRKPTGSASSSFCPRRSPAHVG